MAAAAGIVRDHNHDLSAGRIGRSFLEGVELDSQMARAKIMTGQDQIVLAAEGLSKRFGGNTVVDRVSISFTKGRSHSILGPNGAGKTTSFNLSTRDLAPDSGTIRLGAADITGLTPDHV
ncbi:hypothetical protein OY671_010915, partial [Metschnikowia pulcherrima]